MIRLRSISSWLGVIFILLFLFTSWYFLLRSNTGSGEELLPKKVCSKNYPRQMEEVYSWQMFYYKKGCAAINDSDALISLASWLREDNKLIIKEMKLPSLEPESALLLTQEDGWQSKSSGKSASAIITLGENSPLARYYLDSALIDIAVQRKYPQIRKARDIAETLALDLKHNRYLDQETKIDIDRETLLTLLPRCQESDCRDQLQDFE